MLLKRYLSIFVCVLTFILTFIYYEKPLHSEESENIDSLISAMWDRIGSQVEGISSSTKSSYEEKLQEKFKVRGIDETELGKKKIEELKKEFSDGLKSYFPKRDLQKYKNRILGIEADKREAEIEKIIKEEVDSAQTSFDNFLNTKNNEISAKVSETEKEIEDRLVENLVKEITDKQNEENKKLQQYVKDKLKIEKEYYNKQIKGYSKACKLPIQKNSNLNDQEKQNIFSKCNE